MDAEFADAGINQEALKAGTYFDLGGGAILSIRGTGENGSGMEIDRGSERIDLLFGEPEILSQIVSNKARPAAVTILDHPSESFNLEGSQIFLSAGKSSYSIPDGGWLEIQSEGTFTKILEKVNAAP
jgi:hypothetical protein